jgi:CRISPR type III-associated protein (TIGR04423 family)
MKAIYHNLNEIPKIAFEGYIWKSDESTPEMLRNVISDFENISTNPFIIEGLLYNKEHQISIHIQHTGNYQIAEYDLNALKEEGAVLEEKEYLPHRLTDVSKVNFQQVWMEEKDPLCEKIPVLKMKAVVFCGFNKVK